jgi:hypothetical protein
MIRMSYDVSRMKDRLLKLVKKLQGGDERYIVRIAIPPTGIMAVTRSTGSVLTLLYFDSSFPFH